METSGLSVSVAPTEKTVMDRHVIIKDRRKRIGVQETIYINNIFDLVWYIMVGIFWHVRNELKNEQEEDSGS